MPRAPALQCAYATKPAPPPKAPKPVLTPEEKEVAKIARAEKAEQRRKIKEFQEKLTVNETSRMFPIGTKVGRRRSLSITGQLPFIDGNRQRF